MLISFTHNFIYLRPKKTGSSTIAEILGDSLGPDDVMGGQPKRSVREQRNVNWSGKLDAHLTAKEVSEMTSPEFWRSSFKFASERHPYEKAVSLAYYRLAKGQHRHLRDEGDNIARFIDQTVNNGKYRGFDIYSIDGKVVVDDFIRYENLDADLRRICDRVGVPMPDELPRNKGKARKDFRPAREILNEKQKRTVFEFCREEFELFGYEP